MLWNLLVKSEGQVHAFVIYIDNRTMNQVKSGDLYPLLFRSEVFQIYQEALILNLSWLSGNTPASTRAVNGKPYSTSVTGVLVSWNTQMTLNAPVVFQNFIHNVLALDWCTVIWYNNHPLYWKTRVIFTFALPWDFFVKMICLSNPNKVTVMVFLHNVFQETIDVPLLDHCFDTGSLAAASTN